MKQIDNEFTVELFDKPRRGRPRGVFPAMTAAERMRKSREERGLVTLTVQIPSELFAGLNEYMKHKDLTKNQVIEKLIQNQLLRKR